jgi:hypothetical protein
MSHDIMQRARQRMKDRMSGKPRTIEVPELEMDGKPLLVHVWPLTSAEYTKIRSFAGELERAAETIVQRAKDENGNQLFKNEREEILRDFDPVLIVTLATKLDDDIAEEARALTIREVGN